LSLPERTLRASVGAVGSCDFGDICTHDLEAVEERKEKFDCFRRSERYTTKVVEFRRAPTWPATKTASKMSDD